MTYRLPRRRIKPASIVPVTHNAIVGSGTAAIAPSELVPYCERQLPKPLSLKGGIESPRCHT
ncbi:hypothetical protein [Bythopirellula polymerisocia]|uniref:hypothetical protein n=1 Tax=Bythopirellula polymerisocia TaxID=2528003 RepID=UPI0011B78510|nr:hypothetical protein [Bythopirellula polymerisocia]